MVRRLLPRSGSRARRTSPLGHPGARAVSSHERGHRRRGARPMVTRRADPRRTRDDERRALDTPAVVVDLDRVDDARSIDGATDAGARRRVAAARQDAQEPRGRAPPARRRRGRPDVGTIGEAEVFADGGFDDLFIAYPLMHGCEGRSNAGAPRGRRAPARCRGQFGGGGAGGRRGGRVRAGATTGACRDQFGRGADGRRARRRGRAGGRGRRPGTHGRGCCPRPATSAPSARGPTPVRPPPESISTSTRRPRGPGRRDDRLRPRPADPPDSEPEPVDLEEPPHSMGLRARPAAADTR